MTNNARISQAVMQPLGTCGSGRGCLSNMCASWKYAQNISNCHTHCVKSITLQMQVASYLVSYCAEEMKFKVAVNTLGSRTHDGLR